jgi:hypothetical protein
MSFVLDASTALSAVLPTKIGHRHVVSSLPRSCKTG